MPSFHDAAMSCYLAWRFGGIDEESSVGFRSGLQRTEVQARALLDELVDLGLFEHAKSGWQLSRAGQRLGSQMAAALDDSRTRISRRSQRSFLEHVPRNWTSEVE
jgi:hypothetical protein